MNAYLDACILLAYTNGPKANQFQYNTASRIMRDIKQKKYKGVITHIALQEILNILRRQIGSNHGHLFNLPEPDRMKYVNTEARRQYSLLLTELLRGQVFTFPNCDEISAGTINRDGLILLDRHFGEVKLGYRKCNQCGYSSNKSEYKGLSPSDVAHIMLAHELHCDQFFTFDQGYEILQNEKKLNPTQIIVFRP